MKHFFVKIKDWFCIKQNLIEIGIIFFFFTASFILRYFALIQTPFSNGWDGYFYLEQLQALIETGKFHSPDSSFIYPFLKLIYYFTQDYVLALKIASALLTSFFTLSLYFLTQKITEKNTLAFFAASLCLFSPSLTFFASQFPKNLMGLVFFNFMALFLISKKIIPAFLFLIFAFITHRFTAGISLIFIILYLSTRIDLIKKYKWYLLGLAALAPISLALPGTLHFADLERLKELMAFHPQFAPYSFFSLLGFEKFNFFWFFECGLYFFLLFINLFFILLSKQFHTVQKKNTFIFIGMFFMLIFPFFVFDLNGPAYRFYFAFLLLCPIVLMPAFAYFKNQFIFSIAFLFIVLSIFSFRSYQPTVFDPPYSYYQTLIEKYTKLLPDKDVELIIAHKGIAEMATFLTKKDTMAWNPESSFNKKKIWRLAAELTLQDFEKYLGKDDLKLVLPVTLRYTLIREDLWNTFCTKVKMTQDEDIKAAIVHWKNPSQNRPNYLMNKRQP